MTLDDANLNSVGPRIRMMLPSLTPREAHVVESVLAMRDFGPDTALKAIADSTGVSEAMVVKIAKKLGFDGYRGLRSALSQYNRLPAAAMHQEVSPEDTSREIVQKVFRTSIRALEEPLAILDLDAFDRAVDVQLSRLRRKLATREGGEALIKTVRGGGYQFTRPVDRA